MTLWRLISTACALPLIAGSAASCGDDSAEADASNLPDAWQNPDAPSGPDASTVPDAVPPPDVYEAPPWGTPVLIGALSDPLYQSRAPAVSPNGLELYFDSDRGDEGFDIWRSTRASTSDPWGAPAKVEELSDDVLWDTGPALSPSGLTIWLSRNAEDDDRDIYVATRSSTSAPWSSPSPVAELNTGSDEGGVAVSPNALMMAFESNRSGTLGRLDIFVSTRTSTADPWGTPEAVLGVNSTYDDVGPCFTDDGLTLYFSAYRPGRGGDIFFAVRDAATEPFAAPFRIDEVSSTGADFDPWVSTDEQYMVFGSRRAGDVMDLYESNRL